MTDIAITPAEVLMVADNSNVVLQGTAGGTITAGMPIYLDSGDSTYKPADANVSIAAASVVGIALHGASTGQPIRLQTAGLMKLGAAAAPATGMMYVLSANVGCWAPCTDLAAGMYSTILGYGVGTNNVHLCIEPSGQQV